LEDFIVNLAIASFGLLVGGAVFFAIINWAFDQFMYITKMELADWIAVSVFFGVAAMIASTM